MSKHEYAGELPFWYDGKSVNEVGFCEEFLQQHPMVCVGGSFFTKDGRITDEEPASLFSSQKMGRIL